VVELFTKLMHFKDLATLYANFNVDYIANQNSTFLPFPLFLSSRLLLLGVLSYTPHHILLVLAYVNVPSMRLPCSTKFDENLPAAEFLSFVNRIIEWSHPAKRSLKSWIDVLNFFALNW